MVAFKRDPIREGQVTLSVTFVIPGSSDARSLFVLQVSRVADVK